MTDLYSPSESQSSDLVPAVVDVDVRDLVAEHRLPARALGTGVGLVAAAFGSYVVGGGQAGQLLFGMFLSLAFLWTVLCVVAGVRWGLLRLTSGYQ